MILDLSKNEWTLTGWHKNRWKLQYVVETGLPCKIDYGPYNVKIPGSVHTDLMSAGLLKDINIDTNFLDAEWVENREWVYETKFKLNKQQIKERYLLCLEGLDYSGIVLLNGKNILNFKGTHLSWKVDISHLLKESEENILNVVFYCPPDTTSLGYTHEEKTLKSRFNYLWDWCPRLVNIGIWKNIYVKGYNCAMIKDFYPKSSAYREETITNEIVDSGNIGIIDIVLELEVLHRGSYELLCIIKNDEDIAATIHKEIEFRSSNSEKCSFNAEIANAKLWYPNGMGAQNLYDIDIEIYHNDELVDSANKKVGFKKVFFKSRRPEETPYLLNINDEDLFLRGANWVPISPFYGTITRDRYERDLETFKKMNVNILRVWGGAILESQDFYELCDEKGILVWQEFPQSSSGIMNFVCEELDFVEDLLQVSKEYIIRRRHHVSHIIWCGGNELLFNNVSSDDGLLPQNEKTSYNLLMLKKLVEELDAGKCYYPASPNGENFIYDEKRIGKHTDTHGPWDYLGQENHYKTFNNDDSFLKSEVGSPAPARLNELVRYCDKLDMFPPNSENILWNSRGNWWIRQKEMSELFKDFSRQDDMTDFFKAFRYCQFEALRYATTSMRRKFPECAGTIIWMANEPFPNCANTSLIEYDGTAKPSYYGVARAYSNFCIHLEYDKINYKRSEMFNAKAYICADKKFDDCEVNIFIADIRGTRHFEKTFNINYGGPVGLIGDLNFSLFDYKSDIFMVGFECYNRNVVKDSYLFTVEGDKPFGAFFNQPKASVSYENLSDDNYKIINNSEVVALMVFVNGIDDKNCGVNVYPNYINILPGENINCKLDREIKKLEIDWLNQ